MKKACYGFVRTAAGFGILLILVCSCATPTTRTPTYSSVALEQEQHRQKCLALEENKTQEERLADVSFRILQGASVLSSKTKDCFGFYAANPAFFQSDYRAAAMEVYHLENSPEISHVVLSSPCQLAGLQEGDQIISMDGKAFPNQKKELAKYFKELDTDHAIDFLVDREGERIPIHVNAVHCVDCNVRLVNSDSVNAYADGTNVFVTKGMMRFVANDDELAMVISHELAHNIRKHPDMMRTNAVAGGFLGVLADVAAAACGVNTQGNFTKLGMQAGRNAYSKDMEAEADYVGLYILAGSGYDIHKGPNLFRRMGASKPKSIEMKYARSHPSTPERFVMLEETIREIEVKQEAGAPLIPEEKKKTAAQSEAGNPLRESMATEEER